MKMMYMKINVEVLNISDDLDMRWCDAAAPPGHVAMSGPANIMFLRSELGQSGTFLSWLRHSESGWLGTP